MRLGGWVDLTVVGEAGDKELRQFNLWSQQSATDDPLDHDAVKAAVLRLAAWAGDAPAPIRASYHWWRPDRVEIERDGLRSPLPHPVGPGEQVTLAFRFRAPDQPGRYLLAVDLVEEGLAWFSDAGVPPLAVPITVTSAA